jgi:hypothetical protein
MANILQNMLSSVALLSDIHGNSPALKLVCNLGSVGATLDGASRASWVNVEQMPGGAREVNIRRLNYDGSLIHQLIDQTSDDYGFEEPGYTEAYKRWFSTGIHGKVHFISR